jgi:hypothetical protein
MRAGAACVAARWSQARDASSLAALKTAAYLRTGTRTNITECIYYKKDYVDFGENFLATAGPRGNTLWNY